MTPSKMAAAHAPLDHTFYAKSLLIKVSKMAAASQNKVRYILCLQVNEQTAKRQWLILKKLEPSLSKTKRYFSFRHSRFSFCHFLFIYMQFPIGCVWFLSLPFSFCCCHRFNFVTIVSPFFFLVINSRWPPRIRSLGASPTPLLLLH